MTPHQWFAIRSLESMKKDNIFAAKCSRCGQIAEALATNREISRSMKTVTPEIQELLENFPISDCDTAIISKIHNS